ncbi:zinc finger MYM-type 1-like, partial [Paramuricea clavata]
DFLRYHRQRKPSRRIDDNPNTTANLNVESFYRKEFKAVLDSQINTFTDVLENCVATIKPLFQALQPGQEPSSIQTFEALAKFHPDKDRPDPDALMSEIETAAKKAEEMKLVFPLTNRSFRLVLTAPVTVAKDEQTFSKLKTVKNLCRSRTNDERLEKLMFMACEKDITDEIPVQNLATLWASLKSRRITIGPVLDKVHNKRTVKEKYAKKIKRVQGEEKEAEPPANTPRWAISAEWLKCRKENEDNENDEINDGNSDDPASSASASEDSDLDFDE